MHKNNFFSPIIDYLQRLDKILVLIIIFISTLSLLLLQSVSRATNTDYFQTQLFAITLGCIAAFVLTNIDYETIGNYWGLIALFSIFIMLYALFFGVNIAGSGGVSATAWIQIAGRSFQPSELVKILFLLTFAKHVNALKKRSVLNKPVQVVFLFAHACIPILLCHLQGDDGAGIVFFAMFVCMAYASGIKKIYFFILAIICIVSIPVLWEFVLSDYQKARFTAVYNLDDPTVAANYGYQQYQARISIGSGGFFGTGLFAGPRVESNLVTFQHSDFIFSVVGEELGFVGCVVVILSLLALMWRVIYIANKSRDISGKVICYGFFGIIALQSFSNIGMCLALLPVMGVTLPFYSAGGSSAACLYLGIGLIESVYMHRDYESGVRLRYKKSEILTYNELQSL